MLDPVVIQGIQPGGQLTITTDVENYPGFAEVIQGPWLMAQMQEQAAHVGTEMIMDHITDVDLSVRRSFSPVMATRNTAAMRLSSARVRRRNGSTCHPKRNSRASAFQHARPVMDFSTVARRSSSSVAATRRSKRPCFSPISHRASRSFHRRNEFRAEKILQDRLFKNPKVEVLWDTVLEEVLGDSDPKTVSAAKLKNVKSGEIVERAVDGIFIAIGHAPATELFVDKLDMKRGGYIITAPDSTATSIPGVFAAGDVTDDIYRQAVTAAGMGCMAALEAEKFIAASAEAQEAAE